MLDTSIKLTFVGDICPADMRFTKGFGLNSKFIKGEGIKWEKNLKELTKSSDIAFCNLEAPLIPSEKFDSDYHFAGTLAFADFIKRSGFDIVSIANNHILEEGIEGFNSTIKQLDKSKIKYIGKYDDESSNIEIITIKEKRIGFVAFNAVDLEKINNPKLFAEFSEKSVFKALDNLNELNVDYKIFSFHWGNEYINIPSRNQIEFAHKLIDSGVNIIVGHHSHVIQPIEEYNKGLIIYSLGNCLFDSTHSVNTKHGLCIKVKINEGITYSSIDLKLSNLGVMRDDSLTAKKRFDIINSNFSNLVQRNNYNKIYKKLTKKNRFRERINMKKLLIRNIILGRFKDKSKLLRNVFNFYINRK